MGLSRINFKAKLPFYGMRPGFAAFRKEVPTALPDSVRPYPDSFGTDGFSRG